VYSPAYSAAPQPAYPAYGGQAYRPAPQANVEFGRVANIEVLQHEERRAPSGAGAIIGGVLGAVVGNQVGGGFGRAAATGIGAVGGAVAGNALEGNQRGPTVQTYRISVQTDNGRMEVFDVPNPGDLRIGDRVRLDDGRIQRM
jgi:outer membrane lipoprotein SlyB